MTRSKRAYRVERDPSPRIELSTQLSTSVSIGTAKLDVSEHAYLHEAVGNALESLYGEQSEQIAVESANLPGALSSRQRGRRLGARIWRAGEMFRHARLRAPRRPYPHRDRVMPALRCSHPLKPASCHCQSPWSFNRCCLCISPR
jgi:hypothetical protein